MKNKKQTYSGDSIASKVLSGTWLGKLLGYGNNTYTDGYGTTRAYAPLNESAQGQQLKRMGDTAKDAGKIVLTGAAFMNPLQQASAVASLLGTGAQAYFLTEGLKDAYSRFMNPNKTVGDVVWTGLDLVGAAPAVKGVRTGAKYVWPEMKKSFKNQARITAKQYADYQPTTVLTKVGEGEPPKPFVYLWDESIPLDTYTPQQQQAMEDAATKGFIEAYDILSNPKVRAAQEANTAKHGRLIFGWFPTASGKLQYAPKITYKPEEVASGSLWPSTVKFTNTFDDPYAIGAATNLGEDNYRVYTPLKLRQKLGFPLKLRPTTNYADLATTAKHESLHANNMGFYPSASKFRQRISSILNDQDYDAFLSRVPKHLQGEMNYVSSPWEMASWNLVDFKPLHGVSPGQKTPTTKAKWEKFYKKLDQNLWGEVPVDLDTQSYFRDLYENALYNRTYRLTDPDKIKKFDETLWSLFNGTAY